MTVANSQPHICTHTPTQSSAQYLHRKTSNQKGGVVFDRAVIYGLWMLKIRGRRTSTPKNEDPKCHQSLAVQRICLCGKQCESVAVAQCGLLRKEANRVAAS